MLRPLSACDRTLLKSLKPLHSKHFVFSDKSKEYQDETRDSFLSKALLKVNSLSQEEITKLETVFKKSMIAAFDIFNSNAFRKISRKNTRKFPINKSLFEVWSVNLGKLDIQNLEILKERKKELIDNFFEYVDNDTEFLVSISQAANKIEHRFETVEKIIQEVLS
ncbi:MAG: hypothetical protein RMY34_31980 [Aulosira sp. DedQUE10]|nr:hypothetical protein [Aulosira sp. DedQUE10]